MATTQARSGQPTVNDGGTIVNAGNVAADSRVTETIALNEQKHGGQYGSVPVIDAATGGAFEDPHGVTKAKSAGTFAYFPDERAGERNFLLRAAGDSASKINNSSTTILTTPGSEFAGIGRDGVHEVVGSVRIGEYASSEFNVLAAPSSGVVSGRTKGANAGTAVNYVQVDGSTAATDDAATPTRAVPGELTYHFGGLGRPTTDEYKAKDSFEDATDTSS